MSIYRSRNVLRLIQMSVLMIMNVFSGFWVRIVVCGAGKCAIRHFLLIKY